MRSPRMRKRRRRVTVDRITKKNSLEIIFAVQKQELNFPASWIPANLFLMAKVGIQFENPDSGPTKSMKAKQRHISALCERGFNFTCYSDYYCDSGEVRRETAGMHRSRRQPTTAMLCYSKDMMRVGPAMPPTPSVMLSAWIHTSGLLFVKIVKRHIGHKTSKKMRQAELRNVHRARLNSSKEKPVAKQQREAQNSVPANIKWYFILGKCFSSVFKLNPPAINPSPLKRKSEAQQAQSWLVCRAQKGMRVPMLERQIPQVKQMQKYAKTQRQFWCLSLLVVVEGSISQNIKVGNDQMLGIFEDLQIDHSLNWSWACMQSRPNLLEMLVSPQLLVRLVIFRGTPIRSYSFTEGMEELTIELRMLFSVFTFSSIAGQICQYFGDLWPDYLLQHLDYPVVQTLPFSLNFHLECITVSFNRTNLHIKTQSRSSTWTGFKIQRGVYCHFGDDDREWSALFRGGPHGDVQVCGDGNIDIIGVDQECVEACYVQEIGFPVYGYIMRNIGDFAMDPEATDDLIELSIVDLGLIDFAGNVDPVVGGDLFVEEFSGDGYSQFGDVGAESVGEQEDEAKTHMQILYLDWLQYSNGMRTAEVETESLQSKISQLRNTVYRLECRNRLDRASEESLRKQLKQLQSQVVPKMEIKYVEILKEVRVIEKDERVQDELKEQLHAAQLKIDELMSEVSRGDSERAKQEDNAQRLRREIEWLKQGKARDLSEQRKIKELLEEREKTITKYQQQFELVNRNREVVVHTNHVFPDFQSRQRQEKQVSIETVYVDRPVEKVVVVEVEKQITHFINAPRPCFNKVVQYPCSGQDEEEKEGNDREGDKWEARIEMLEGELMGRTKQIQELRRQIGQYKAERNMMLEVIDGKNSELDCLERRIMRALPQPNRPSFGETQVDVQVIKRGDPTNQPPKVYSKGNPPINPPINPKTKGKK